MGGLFSGRGKAQNRTRKMAHLERTRKQLVARNKRKRNAKVVYPDTPHTEDCSRG